MLIQIALGLMFLAFISLLASAFTVKWKLDQVFLWAYLVLFLTGYTLSILSFM